MFVLILSILFALLGAWLLIKPPKITMTGRYNDQTTMFPTWIFRAGGAFSVLCGFIAFLSLSYVNVGADNIATLHRVYMASDLPEGRIIALDGQKGPQADILGPGFHISPFIRFLNDIDADHPVVEIPSGGYGLLVARDGAPLRDNQFIADKWPEDQVENMLDARYFLENGGQKGTQLDVLRPGKYRINPLLWEVKIQEAVDVPTGTVAVIRSNVQTAKQCKPIAIEGETGASVSTPIVPNNCIGVWAEPLMPGRYYLNSVAYIPTIIPTRLTTWTYKGGYSKRTIDLDVESDGTISQKESSEKVGVPENATGEAITVRAEGWEFPVEVRAVVQVHPKDAPIVVASIGDLKKVEDNIVTPTVRDVLRTIGGAEGRKVMDFVTKRDEIVSAAEAVVAVEAAKAGVSLQELRLGEAAIPPELMIATLREQLAVQLKATYVQEKAAQAERIATEKERATANQQPMLVKAELERDAAQFQKQRAKLEGEGERDRLIAIAAGQQKQTDVLGADRVAALRMFEMALQAAVQNPEIVKVPVVNVANGDGGTSLEGAAAILGASNLVNAAGANTVKSE